MMVMAQVYSIFETLSRLFFLDGLFRGGFLR